MAQAVGAWLWVDAVHYAPHGPIDVQALGCDFLVCSPYKFFGPHSGVLWGRYELLERLRAYKVRPAGNLPPDKFETGTQSHEAQAGALAAIDYLAELGEEFGAPFAGQFPGFSGRRLALKQAMAAIQAYERPLFEHFVAGLLAIPGLSFYGIRDFDRFDRRTPTAAFRLAGRSPARGGGTPRPPRRLRVGGQLLRARRHRAAGAGRDGRRRARPGWRTTIRTKRWTTAWRACERSPQAGVVWLSPTLILYVPASSSARPIWKLYRGPICSEAGGSGRRSDDSKTSKVSWPLQQPCSPGCCRSSPGPR